MEKKRQRIYFAPDPYLRICSDAPPRPLSTRSPFMIFRYVGSDKMATKDFSRSREKMRYFFEIRDLEAFLYPCSHG